MVTGWLYIVQLVTPENIGNWYSFSVVTIKLPDVVFILNVPVYVTLYLLAEVICIAKKSHVLPVATFAETSQFL